VRNGQRWHVTAINPDNNRLIARRLDDNTLGAFDGDYLREHITYGYAVTVHAAQGVTADTTHAVLGDTATRALSYVAITRGRDTNTAYLYERTIEQEYPEESSQPGHVMHRGSSWHAAKLLRAILANDEHRMTAHDIAAVTEHASLAARVRGAIDQRGAAVRRRAADYGRWRSAAASFDHAMREARGRDIGLDRSLDF
jgi:hypothetical protein